MPNETANAYVYMTPQQAWDELRWYKSHYYDKYIAAYTGFHNDLHATGEPSSFWRRDNKCRIHVPIAADIAATSSDLLFSEEPRFTCFDEATEDNESIQQTRLDEIIAANNLHGLLNEAAESCAVLGDVFLKLNLRPNDADYPIITVAQGDSAFPEYVLGVLKCIHFFQVLKKSNDGSTVWRTYERYEHGKVTMAVFKGTSDTLGMDVGDAALDEIGYSREITLPTDELCACHIVNMKPNRYDRGSIHGRSDIDGLRGMMDALDETYSSWIRDIRLAKARTIVPAEYLRRKASDMFDNSYTYEFDTDVESFVALDIDTDKSGGITASQFAIRSAEFSATCTDLIRNIVTIAGYAPQTFGLDINGMAQSGTALHIREKKSYNTLGKKQNYWKQPLEKLLTTMVHLDAAIFKKGSDLDDRVKMEFADSISNDLSTMSNALQTLNNAQAISTEMKIQMLHPDWSQKQVQEEIDRVRTEYGISGEQPIEIQVQPEPNRNTQPNIDE